MAGTLYDVLGVSPAASAAELRSAYVREARRRHPDAGGDAAAMTRLNQAWAVLSDPVRRRVYDLELGRVAPGVPPPPTPADEFEEIVPAEVRRGWLPFVPPAVFALSIATGSVGLVLDEPGVVGAALGLFLLSCVAIAAVALLTLRANIRR